MAVPLALAVGLVLAITLVVFLAIVTFNNVVSLQRRCERAWANIDVALKQRHDQLPSLVSAVRGAMAFEEQVLEAVTRARAAYQPEASIHDQAVVSEQTSSALRSLFATVEAYPELKTAETFQHLLSRITGLENAIADRREFYNESVNINNVRVEQFPDSIIATFFRFRSFDLLQFSSEEKKDVDVKTLFAS